MNEAKVGDILAKNGLEKLIVVTQIEESLGGHRKSYNDHSNFQLTFAFDPTAHQRNTGLPRFVLPISIAFVGTACALQ